MDGVERKNFLIRSASSKLDEVGNIINNASKQCSSLKMLFITLGVPASISLFAIYYGVDKSKRIGDLFLFPCLAFILYFLLLIVSLNLYYSFYARQVRYRKVKESIERLKENLEIEFDTINVDITSENFNRYYHCINLISKKTSFTYKTLLKSILDSLQITIPLGFITIYWLVVNILHCCGVTI